MPVGAATFIIVLIIFYFIRETNKNQNLENNYSNEELNTLFEMANQSGAEALITTYKDFVKIPPDTISFPIYALAIDFHLAENEEKELLKIFKRNRVL